MTAWYCKPINIYRITKTVSRNKETAFLFVRNAKLRTDWNLYHIVGTGLAPVPTAFIKLRIFVELRLPLTGNICDRRLWRMKEASVGAAVDFVRRSKPHKQNRAPQEGNRWHVADVTKGETQVISNFRYLSLSHFSKMKNDSSLVRGSLCLQYAWSAAQKRPQQSNYNLHYTVGANCVRPLFITAEFDGRPQVPLRVVRRRLGRAGRRPLGEVRVNSEQ